MFISIICYWLYNNRYISSIKVFNYHKYWIILIWNTEWPNKDILSPQFCPQCMIILHMVSCSTLPEDITSSALLYSITCFLRKENIKKLWKIYSILELTTLFFWHFYWNTFQKICYIHHQHESETCKITTKLSNLVLGFIYFSFCNFPSRISIFHEIFSFSL